MSATNYFANCLATVVKIVALPVIFAALLNTALADKTLKIENSWVRENPPTAPTTAAYMTITNTGDQNITLTGAKSSAASAVQIHEMKMENDTMQMREIESVEIPAGDSIELKPGGFHIMLIGLNSILKEDDQVEIELMLSDDTSITTTVPVKKAD